MVSNNSMSFLKKQFILTKKLNSFFTGQTHFLLILQFFLCIKILSITPLVINKLLHKKFVLFKYRISLFLGNFIFHVFIFDIIKLI